tara:strand:+ start:368 stop:904 length:537 start_codon:yes stop_codon:yes gene_type:complete
MKLFIFLFLFLLSTLSFVKNLHATESNINDTSLPIEIESNNLEVNQKSKIATFTGKVIAKQGYIRLKADELKVHYSASQNNDVDKESVTKIKASGKVFFSTRNETAQSDNGTYDVSGKKIFLRGNVILTQGDNVIRGNYLILDLKTGKNVVKGAEPGVSNESSANKRVRGLFVPNTKK